MSSTAVIGFVKDIKARNVKAVRERLGNVRGESPNQRFIDPAAAGRVYTLLHKAAAVGCVQVVDALIKAGADVNGRDQDGATPLHWLAACPADAEHLEVAAALLSAKADVQAVDHQQGTPLHAAAKHDNAPLIGVLAAAAAGLEVRDAGGCSPVHSAATGGCMRALEALVAAGANLATADAHGWTPLMLLLSHGHAKEALQLIQHHGSVACAVDARETCGGRTALSLAAERAGSGGISPPAWAEVLDALLAAGASPDVQDAAGDTVLMQALRAGRLPLVPRLLPYSKDLDAANARGDSALSLLLAAMRAPAASGGDGSSVPVPAASAASPAGVQLRGADPSPSARATAAESPAAGGGKASCASRAPPLQTAGSSRQSAKGSSSAQRTSAGQPPRRSLGGPSSKAAGAAHAVAASRPTVAGSSPAAAPAAGPMPASEAIRRSPSGGRGLATSATPAAPPSREEGFVAARQLLVTLLKRGAKPSADAGQALFAEAWASGDDEISALLVHLVPRPVLEEAGLRGYDEAATRWPRMPATAVALAVRDAREQGTDWRGAQDDSGATYLIRAAVSGGEAAPSLCSALMDAGADANAADAAGDAALHHAARAGAIGVCNVLIARGADVLRRNGRNRTPGGQLHLCESVREMLAAAEEVERAARAERKRTVWDPKLAATQTATACVLRAV
ncbi:hypothetical protein Rsub_12218 [Raphidocelis subcapitata]|uniref:Uncharacterized protein n=1 Tax=Raphidocelis subcapitata TaxID=307507 RepID=A0A2V0PJ08_9CHLO|nr:hypothetical protein Rsub_12218 [Raphidocelis subcapitata]|eukprot:GBF99778.1 hypothetical protein Rsub_12218 [Raphidocelis subcapitata]